MTSSTETSPFIKTQLPCKITFAQSIKLKYQNEITTFIFGSLNNLNIYKYDNKSKNYKLFDKYK